MTTFVRLLMGLLIFFICTGNLTAQQEYRNSPETVISDSQELREGINRRMKDLDSYLNVLADSTKPYYYREEAIHLIEKLFQPGSQVRDISLSGQQHQYRLSTYLSKLRDLNMAKLSFRPEIMQPLFDSANRQSCIGYMVEGQYGWRQAQVGWPQNGAFQCRVYIQYRYDSFFKMDRLTIELGNISLN